MSTEAPGDDQSDDAVNAVGPGVAAEDTDAATTVVTEPAVAEPSVVATPAILATGEPTAWGDAAPTATDTAGQADLAPDSGPATDEDGQAGNATTADKDGQAGEPLTAGRTLETSDVPVPSEADNADETGDADESDEGSEPAEEYEEYEYYEGDETSEYDEALEYDDDGEEYDEYGPEGAAEPQRARRWPRVLLALGFVVLGAGIVGGAVAIVGSATHGFKKPVKITYEKSALFSLKTGECFDQRGQAYTLISCDSPHEAEVYATFTLSGAKWPGTAAVAREASTGCASRLTGYLNPQLAISLASTYVYPDSVAWQAGTRSVICEVRAANGELTGSVRGGSASAG